MTRAAPAMTLQQAREILGVGVLATPGEVRRAFREAAKRLHPDRPGGSSAAFLRVTEAHQRLTASAAVPLPPPSPPAEPAVDSALLRVPPQVAFAGGQVEHRLAGGRRIRITLPAGLRQGDKVDVADLLLTVTLGSAADVQVRGDDVWITAQVPPRTLKGGGRIALETPLGRRIVWITRKDAERGLVRLTGQGLPPRGRHGRGHLFVRLAAEVGPAQSSARTLLDRFAAAWAA